VEISIKASGSISVHLPVEVRTETGEVRSFDGFVVDDRLQVSLFNYYANKVEKLDDVVSVSPKPNRVRNLLWIADFFADIVKR
jgi:hypothetical protein